MSHSSRIIQEKAIHIPKHLLSNREEASPYVNSGLKRTRIILCPKKQKLTLKREKAMQSMNQQSHLETLITVERNYVRELIKSPIKSQSKSPNLTQKTMGSIPSKIKVARSRFESLTICDFIVCASSKKSSVTKRSKYSLTPELFSKRTFK